MLAEHPEVTCLGEGGLFKLRLHIEVVLLDATLYIVPEQILQLLRIKAGEGDVEVRALQVGDDQSELFRKRMRQLRLTIFSTILLVGYVIIYAIFAYFYQLKLEQISPEDIVPTFHLRFVAVFPLLSIIFNCLAIQGIRKDEALVRSLDRIR